MYKIRKVKFDNHPILKNLELDFCDKNGNAVDTVIFAGENGCGKSTIINALYEIASYSIEYPIIVEVEKENKNYTLEFYYRNSETSKALFVKDGTGLNAYSRAPDPKNKHPFCGIFSDVDINFHSGVISNVTSLTLDSTQNSRRSTNDLPTQINQLLIDIQALDDAFFSRRYKEAKEKGESVENLIVDERISRFKRAFDYMFDGLTYSHIDNRNGAKTIIFTKNGVEIPIENLSSGEKQIVYRGCFLLKDANATNGAFVFIDEPEISLHPKWQMKIMDYYKGIFTNESGEQTSQIFAVTHSPFIIHNDKRKNDKVIVLARNENGNIIVKDKPEYFMCNSIEAVQDAFSVSNFSSEQPTVYLEGRTDEMYFNKALEVFELEVPFRFQWVGHLKNNNSEEFSGKDNLNKAFQFMVGCKPKSKGICLFDCDTNRREINENNVYIKVIPPYDNAKGMKKGIENALVLDSIDTESYYSKKTKEGDYGEKSEIAEFKKMDFCKYICALDNDTLKTVLANLKAVIDEISKIFEE